jgi:hypothetical protein
MAYTAQISRNNPTAFLFVVDQSESMSDQMSSGRSKAEFVADALNRTLMNLVTRCTKSEGVRDYFDVGVLGYGGSRIANGLSGALGARVLNPVSMIEQHPAQIEDRKRKMDDGAGGIVETRVKFPVWFGALASGGTPMCEALRCAAAELVEWCEAHPDSHPPTLLHVTDGESTDGNPEEIADELRRIHTDDGEVLLLNIHVSSLGNDPVRFPDTEAGLPDEFAKMLYRMSSPLPQDLIRLARDKGHPVGATPRGFMFNAEAAEIVDFFDIGTRAAQLR